MFYFFYKTTNKINGKIYFGVHSTKKLDDSYLGSGNAIKSAIRKYGKDNFQREIVKFFDNKEDMFAYEKETINESIVKDQNTYNETVGGRGGFSHIDSSGENNPMKKREVVEKHIRNKKLNGSYHTPKALEASRNNFKIASEKNKGKKRPEHSKFVSSWMTEFWASKSEEEKKKRRDLLSSWFIVQSPSGETFRTNRLGEFCKERDLAYSTLWTTSNTKIPPKKGRSKGWICVKEELQ